MKRSMALVMAIAAAGMVASTGSAKHPTDRSGVLHVTKECSEYHGIAGEFCTIKSSNLGAIRPGMRVVYSQALGSDLVLDSDLVLSSGHGGAALGHVVLDLHTNEGRVTFSGGTIRFAGFRADVDVSFDDSSGLWRWDGTYTFTRPDDDD
jgi:hypothetical protein